MRPQDIVVLAKIVALKTPKWKQLELSKSLYMSQSEISEGMNRCKLAKLVDARKKVVNKAALFEFLVHGIKYVFPLEPGRLVYGLPTAYSAACLTDLFPHQDRQEAVYVWEMEGGTVRGESIVPLHKNVALAAKEDVRLHELLALVDVIRLGLEEEQEKAVSRLGTLLA